MSNFGQLNADFAVADQEAPKRAIIKPAPTCFTVEVLAPTKQGKAHSYGVRILPVNPQQFQAMRDDASSDSNSIQSIGREYEIWRRWDDCLDFQEKLENEYERMSREKKRVLLHGKKGSGDSAGLYRNSNAAASFESLPEGPDPKGIKVDLHAYVPRLSRKSSFFSVSDATVQKRGDEFAAMIYGLFKMDCPKLIEELRDSSTVRDFFAWWQRDQELLDKSMPQRPTSAMSRTKPGPAPGRASYDLTSVFTAPPSPDSPGFSMLKRHEKEYVHAQRSPTESSASIHSPQTPSIRSPPTPSIITTSPRLRGEKMLPSPPISPEQLVAMSPIQRSRSPMASRARGVSPHLQISRPMAHPQYGDHSFHMLSPQSGDHDIRSPVAQHRVGRVFEPREARQASTVTIVHNKNNDGSDSSTPPITPTRVSFAPTVDRERPTSVMSMDSIDSADYKIDLSFVKLDPAPLGSGRGRSKRESVSSISSLSSLATVDSANGVLPAVLRRRSHVSQRPRRRRDGPWSPDERLSVAVPEEDESVFYHSDDSQEGADPFALELDTAFDDTMSYLGKLDSFPDVPRDSSVVTSNGDSDAATRDYYRDRDWRMSFPASVRESMFNPDFDLDAYDVSDPSSPTSPTSPTSTVHGAQFASDSGHSTHSAGTVTSLPLSPGMCSIKAKYADVIVALRLPLGTPLSTLRARLTEKFMQVQGVQLHYRFSLAYTPPRRRFSGLNVPGADEGMPIILSPAALEFSARDSGPASRLHSTRPESGSASPLTRLVPIWSQDDWEDALCHCGNKVVLHVLNQEV
jgi:hypothetical protein